MQILAICGSLRRQSINLTLLERAKALAPEGLEVMLFTGLEQVPLFNPDLEDSAAPTGVTALRTAIATADALLISSPEYARGVPGALKNALDWLVSDHRVAGKAVALLNAASGGAHDATAQLTLILTTMATRVIHAASLVGATVRQNDPSVDIAVQAALAALKSEASRLDHSR